MELPEIAATICALFLGYWIVKELLSRAASRRSAPPPAAPVDLRPQWSKVLDVAPSASTHEIRDAYRHLISKYHPDKVESLAHDIKDLASRRATEITAAYHEGMRSRGADA
jgi:DnaJ like chaperone protein